jgi:hypothetical protein
VYMMKDDVVGKRNGILSYFLGTEVGLWAIGSRGRCFWMSQRHVGVSDGWTRGVVLET